MFCSAQETMKLLPSCDNVGGTCGGFTPLPAPLSRSIRTRSAESIRGVGAVSMMSTTTPGMR